MRVYRSCVADLVLHQHLDASDSPGATAAMQSVFGTGVEVSCAEDTFDFHLHCCVDDGVSVTWITSSGSDVRVRFTNTSDLLSLQVTGGHLEMLDDRGAVPLHTGDIGVVCLESSAEMHWDRVELEVFSFPRASLGRLLGTSAHTLNLRCARSTSRSSALTALWRRTAATLADDVLRTRELWESDVVREQAIDALLAIAVEAFGVSDAKEDVASDAGMIARADAYMRMHLGEPISVPDVAAAVGVSVRGLQLAFSRSRAGTPLSYLRKIRMTAARAAFIAGRSIRSTTVTSTARQLGYTNVGRFTAHYREAFDETPTETLRQARG